MASLWMYVVVVLCYSVLSKVPSVLGYVRQQAPRRGDYAVSEMTAKQKQDMLDAHNRFRSTVQPTAANMEYQVWSDDLANLAQMWTNKCTWSHGFVKFGDAYPRDPTVVLRSDQLGQNLAREYGKISDPEIINRVERWHNEVKYYTFNKFRSPIGADQCVPRKLCGHYTQLVWGLSRNVGCGIRWCNKNFDNGWHPPSNPGETLINCDYAPSGNIIGLYPYKTGRPCSKCASGKGWCYENLCRDCKDHSPSCGTTLTKDKCTVEVEKMRKFCPKMCNLCECPLRCQRGTLIESQCKCSCPSGWRPPDCSEKCEDKPYKTACKNFLNGGRKCEQAFMQENCPATCGICDDGSGIGPVVPTTVVTIATTAATIATTAAPPTRVHPAISPECKDSNRQCPMWAVGGECEKNRNWMLKNCKISCNQCKECQDLLESCPDLALKDDCWKLPEKMLSKCRRSCGLCKVYDKDNYCPAWSAKGHCSIGDQWAWMINNCPQSCDVPLSGVQYCSTKPDGYYPTPISCKGYIDCTSGVTKYIACPNGRAFDKSTKSCRLAEKVMCDEYAEDSKE